MDIAKIETILDTLYKHIEETGEVPSPQLLPVIQCQLLVNIYHMLDSMDSTLNSIDSSVAHNDTLKLYK